MKTPRMYWFPDYNTGENRVKEDRIFFKGKSIDTIQIVNNELIIVYENPRFSQFRIPVFNLKADQYFCHVIFNDKEYKLTVRWGCLMGELIDTNCNVKDSRDICTITGIFRTYDFMVKVSDGTIRSLKRVRYANKKFFKKFENKSVQEIEKNIIGVSIDADTLELIILNLPPWQRVVLLPKVKLNN